MFVEQTENHCRRTGGVERMMKLSECNKLENLPEGADEVLKFFLEMEPEERRYFIMLLRGAQVARTMAECQAGT